MNSNTKVPREAWQKWGLYKVYINPQWYFVIWPPAQEAKRSYQICDGWFKHLKYGWSIKKPNGTISISIVRQYLKEKQKLSKKHYEKKNI